MILRKRKNTNKKKAVKKKAVKKIIKNQMSLWQRRKRMIEYPQRKIELSDIRQNLHLCDYSRVDDFVKSNNIIVNLSGLPIDTNPKWNWEKIEDCKVYDIDFKEDIAFNEFVDILLRINDIIDRIKDTENTVVISCKDGINRSVAIVIGYAIYYSIMSFEQASNYIYEKKMNIDKSWNLFNDLRLINILEKLQVLIPCPTKI